MLMDYRRILLALLTSAIAGLTQASDAPKLGGTVIVGSRVFSPAAFFSTYRDALGQAATVSSARAVLAGIESLYVKDGYYKPQLTLNEELLREGILRIDVFEAQLTAVRVEGRAGPYDRQLATLVQSLRSAGALRRNTIPAALKKLRALPGLSVTATTAADPELKNGFVLKLVLHYQPVMVMAHWSNRGTGSIGPNFVLLQIAENGQLGQEEQAGVLVTSGFQYTEYHGGGAFLDVPLGGHGTGMSMAVFHSTSQPTEPGGPIDLHFPHDLGSLHLTQLIVDRDGATLTALVGLDYDDSIIQFQGTDLESDRLRVAVLGLDVAGTAGEALPYSVALQVRRGLDALGSGVSIIDGTVIAADYSVAKLDAAMIVPLGARWSMRLSVTGQWSGDTLPYEERFLIGTDTLGRAFNTAEIAGDSGLGLKGQLEFPVSGLPSWLGKPTIYGYGDYGTAWLHDINVQQYATTAGTGVRLGYSHLEGSVEVAKPVGFSATLPHGFALLGAVTMRF
jgi:hemolysin activation/secretion protein